MMKQWKNDEKHDDRRFVLRLGLAAGMMVITCLPRSAPADDLKE